MRAAAGFQTRKVGVDLVEVGRDLTFAGPGVTAGQQVFFNAQVRKTVTAFHDLHHPPVDQVCRREIFNAFAAQLDAAFGHFAAFALQQVGDRAQRRGLARTVATQQGHDALFRHLQGHALEHQDHVVVNDFNAVDVQNNVFFAHSLCLFNFPGFAQMKAPIESLARLSFGDCSTMRCLQSAPHRLRGGVGAIKTGSPQRSGV